MTKDPHRTSDNCEEHAKMAKQKTCVLCGELFFPKAPRQVVCNKQHYRPCPVCKKPIPINRPSDPDVCCSRECTEIRRKQRCIDKYGVEHPMQLDSVKQAFKQSMYDLYGVESPLQSDSIKAKAIKSNNAKFGTDWPLANSDVRDRAKHTMIERHGASYTLQCPDLVDAVIKTNIEKYGCSNPMQSLEIRSKVESTNMERYGVKNVMQNTEIAEHAKESRISNNGAFWTTDMTKKAEASFMRNLGVRNPSYSKAIIDKIANTMLNRYGVKSPILVQSMRDKMIRTTEERYGVPYYVISDDYLKNITTFRISSVNKSFARKLEANNIKYSFEYVLDTKSFDICLPDQQILIELNPTYTHNTVGNHWNKNGISESYHLEKSKIAWEHGFRCIHVFDWDNQFEILNLLIPKTKLYARNCTVKVIDRKVSEAFADSNHLQGKCRGMLINYGLYYGDDLVQIMSFGTPRYNSSYQWELLRLCTVSGIYIIGGADRLFSHFIRDHKPDSVISYCDLSKFSGDVYTRLGFYHKKNTPPNKIWSKKHSKITNNLLIQRGFDQLFNTNFGVGTSNETLMLDAGWLPVYDCGQGVYIWEHK